MSKVKWLFQNYWLLLIVLCAKMILQFLVVHPGYELHRDEFLYLDQANHLSAGYISVPPLMAWVSALVFSLGGGVFWVRFFPALFGALTILLAWLMVEELGGKIYSKILVSGALLFSVFVRLNILYQPNAFDILAWTGMFYFLVRYVRCEKPIWLFCLMIVAVLGLYNKYNIAFLLLGVLAGLLLTSYRKIFTNKYFYLVLFSASILILPNVLWQINHHFPVIYHMRELKRTQLDFTSPTGFLMDQVLFVMGSIALILAAFVGFFIHRPFKTYRIVGITFLVTMIIFIVLKAKSYYAFGLYPVLLAFGAVYFESVVSNRWQKYVTASLVTINLAVFIFIYPFIFPVLKPSEIMARKDQFEKLGLLKWNDGKNHHLPQDFADMQGWKEMADKTLQAYEMIPINERKQTLVFCDNYGQTGAVNYYNRNKMPQAYSFNTDYIFWLPRMEKIKNVLLVGNQPNDQVVAQFSACKLVDSVQNEFAIEKNTNIYLLTGANDQFTTHFFQLRDQRIAEFKIF